MGSADQMPYITFIGISMNHLLIGIIGKEHK